MNIDFDLTPADLKDGIQRLWELSARKIDRIEKEASSREFVGPSEAN